MIARAAAEAGTDDDTFRQKMDVVRQPDASDNHILYSAKVPANRPASDYTPRQSRCGSEGPRIRAYECARWSARCRLQEDPQTTRHKAERHEEVRAHEDTNSDTRLRTHAP